jgi:serpin B
MHHARIAFVVLLAVTMVAAGEPVDPKAAAEDCNAFACDLYRAVAAGRDNLLVSPYSVAVALAMTREGARGETAREMSAVLHLPADGDTAAAHAALAKALEPPLAWDHGGQKPKKVPAYELHVANALWGQEGLAFLKPFLTVLRAEFRAPLARLDFADSAKARRTINAWVEKQTRERIKDIVPPPLPTPDTKLALANAIYFKGAWQRPFEDRWTKPHSFFVPKVKVAVPMMHKVDSFAYAETEEAQVLELPYRDGRTSMVIVLPRKPAGLGALEANLTGGRLAGWLQGLKTRRVSAKIPKFEFTCPVNLTETLPRMGMERAFDANRADFRGMTTEVPLFIGAVLHKAFIAVDEAGTEAAAATVVMMELGAAPDPGKPVEFVADHPFLFLIRHRATGCILFLGRLCDPRSS